MSLLDILNTPELKSTLGTFANKAKDAPSGLASQTPGGMGGLLSAGALGALLGTMFSKSLLKDAALFGAGAVAWNFYRKWSREQGTAPEPSQRSSSFGKTDAGLDDTAMLLLRAMVFAARADGHIDNTERERIRRIVEQMFPGRDMSDAVQGLMDQPLDPSVLAAEVVAPEQGEDLYRLSCLIMDIDHFMERSYLDGLAEALPISPERKEMLEKEAGEARRKLSADQTGLS